MSTTSIVEILQRLGTLDWYSIRPSSLADGELPSDALPIITFRFEGGNGDNYKTLHKLLVQSIHAKTWVIIGLGNKNLTLAPEVILDENGIPSLMKAQKLAQQDPEVSMRIGEEYGALLAYLDEKLPV